jgi:predicted permease
MSGDIRVAVRTLARNPGFSLTAVAVLALGIGANSAVFGLVSQALFAPPGLSEPSRILAIRARYAKLNLPSISISGPDFRDVKGAGDVFEAVAVMDRGDVVYGGAGEPRMLQAARVSAGWFDVFGARPMLGRTFVTEEDQPKAPPVAVLAYAAWVRLFGSDPGVVGRTMLVDEVPVKVVGVMPADFRWPREIDLWVPLALPPAELTDQFRFNEHLTGVARTRPGVPLEAADARVRTLAARTRDGSGELAAFAKDAGWGMFAMPYTDLVAGDTKPLMLVLLAAVGSVLLIACANIAGLMLARTASRSREIAVRAALGAGRWQLLRQTLAESFVLSAGGALLGLGLAAAGMRLMLAVAPEGSVVGLQPAIDLRVLAFTIAAAAAAAVLFALAPAWHVWRVAPVEQIKGAARTATGSRGRQRLRSTLVVAETAAAVALLVVGGLLIRSLTRIQEVSPGFETRGVIVGGVTLPERSYKTPEQRSAFYRALVDRVRVTPGVAVAAAGAPLPFAGGDSSASFQIEGVALGPGDPGPHGRMRVVTPEYFAALGIPLRRGRVFTDDDRLGGDPVVVIDENLARRYWPGQDPVGRRVRRGDSGPWMTIVGVVGHVMHSSLVGETDKGTCYLSMYQRPMAGTWLVARLRPGAAESPAIISAAVRAADPTLPTQRAGTLGERVDASLAPRRFVVRVLMFFSAVAVLMAALGLYGVISYSVAQRTQEIGIRMAIGADRRSVLGLVLFQGMGLAAVGVAAGGLLAAACGRMLTAQLYEVSPLDPLTFAGVIVVLMATAAAATWLPARSASRIDPLRALRYE